MQDSPSFIRVTISLPVAVLSLLDDLARADRRSRSSELAVLVEEERRRRAAVTPTS